MQFSERLKELRLEKGLTQRQLAKVTGLSQSAITHWENRLREAGGIAIIKLAQFFDVTAGYLLGIED